MSLSTPQPPPQPPDLCLSLSSLSSFPQVLSIAICAHLSPLSLLILCRVVCCRCLRTLGKGGGVDRTVSHDGNDASDARPRAANGRWRRLFRLAAAVVSNWQLPVSETKHQTPCVRHSLGGGVGMILPVFKLGTLVLKTLCKPIGNRIKKEAGFHPRFRQSIINIAQANHRFTTTLQRRIYGRATDVAIHPLNEEKAVQAAADLMGELFVFSVAGVALVFEVQRSSRSEARKEEMRKQELEVMRQNDEELAREVEQLKHRMSELEQLAKERGLSSNFNLKHSKETDNKTKDAQSS